MGLPFYDHNHDAQTYDVDYLRDDYDPAHDHNHRVGNVDLNCPACRNYDDVARKHDYDVANGLDDNYDCGPDE